MYFDEPKYTHLGLFYVLGYSGSFDMHIIEKWQKNTYFFRKPAKIIFAIRGAQNFTRRTGPQLLGFFFIIVAFHYLRDKSPKKSTKQLDKKN